jgi:phosphatidylglycerol:prolipoprotein diacylglycerol transferase
MLPYPHFDPVLVRIGPIAIRWYGLLYASGIAASYLLVRHQIKKMGPKEGGRKGSKKTDANLSLEFLDPFYLYLVSGIVLGARLGYILFYDFANYANDWLRIFAIWRGGLSFHGGLVGGLLAGYLSCRKFKVDFWRVTDMVMITVPVGLGLGRIGNFINGELYGRVTGVPWGMVFPAGGPMPRHPSQVYEFMLEGVILFVILWSLKNRRPAPGVMTALFLILYGLFRFLAEFFRQPDAQLGFIAGPFTMGQVLSVLTALLGLILLILRKKKAIP